MTTDCFFYENEGCYDITTNPVIKDGQQYITRQIYDKVEGFHGDKCILE